MSFFPILIIIQKKKLLNVVNFQSHIITGTNNNNKIESQSRVTKSRQTDTRDDSIKDDNLCVSNGYKQVSMCWQRQSTLLISIPLRLIIITI